MKKIILFLFTISILGIYSCKDDIVKPNNGNNPANQEDSFINISSQDFSVSSSGEDITFDIESNVEYVVKIDNQIEWMRKKSEEKTDVNTVRYTFTIDENNSELDRSASITVESSKANISKKINVLSYGKSNYHNTGIEGIKGDIKLKVVSGKASSFQNAQDISKSYDDDYSTIYHSSWNNSESDYFPITLEYFFNNEESLDYIVYYPRSSGDNGIFKDVEIFAKYDGVDTYRKLIDYSFEKNNKPTKIVLPSSLKAPKAVKFVVKKGYGDAQGFASCAEMEFYRYNSDKFDATSIFTDETCSELKPNVTNETINNIKDEFYRNLAYHLKKGTYPKEFRIQEYKAWDNPDRTAKLNKNSQYSEIDGVTGIYVERGEKLLVFVGDTHGQSIGLKFVNLDKPNGDGYYDNKSVAIDRGLNIINSPSSGLVYVMYNKDNYKNLKPIKIHFASGKVNGYFDVSKHSAKDWDRLLAKAEYKYFDVVGKKAHLLFETDDYKQHCRSAEDGLGVINQFDILVHDEQVMMGLYKYNRVPGNRALFHVIYTSYMYSTSYRTAYNKSTVGAFLKPGELKRNPWGPAHELGHTHQVRPDVRWQGTTECTVNIPSLYIQTGWGNVSRLETDDRYQDWFNKFFVKGLGHFSADVWGKLVHFWQLKLYIENVLGQEDFYKDLYEKARLMQSPSATVDLLMNFTFMASEASKLNLVDFFDSWGYFKEFEREVDDYGKKHVSVTQRDIDAAREKLNSYGFKKPPYTMRYIADNNWKIFKDKKQIVKGQYNISGNEIFLNNWQNVIAVEVFDKNHNLIYVSNKMLFRMNVPFTSDMKIYAVQYDGQKVLVNAN